MNARPVSALDAMKKAYAGHKLPVELEQRVLQELFERTKQRHRLRPLLVLASGLAAAAVLAVVWFGPSVLAPEKEASAPLYEPAGVPAVAAISRAAADTTLRQGTTSTRAFAPMDLKPGDRVETASHGGARLALGPHSVELDPESQITLERFAGPSCALALERGHARAQVHPLGPGDSFAIAAGDLVVEVVGTIFEVWRDDLCRGVNVYEGQVRATRQGRTATIRAGGSVRFCDGSGLAGPDQAKRAALGDAIARTEAEPLVEAAPETEQGPRAALATGSGKPSDLLPVGAGNDASAPLGPGSTAERTEPESKVPQILALEPRTAEEELYKQGFDALVDGDRRRARTLLSAYIEQYPGGLFAEDALLSLVRIAYAARDMAAVEQRAAAFIERHKAADLRGVEVRVFYAQAVVERQGDPAIARAALEPLVSRLESTRDRYTEQAVYLYMLSQCRAGDRATCREWAGRYLELFPKGRYADEVRKQR